MSTNMNPNIPPMMPDVPRIQDLPPPESLIIHPMERLARPMQTRVTLMTKMYHQLPDFDATSPQTTPYVELMENEEQPYQRRLKVGEEWVPIDFGWTAESGCAFIHIINEYRVRRRVTPMPEVKQEDLLHVLEIGKAIKGLVLSPNAQDGVEYVEPMFALYVGQPITLSPLGQLQYRIRSRYGDGHYSVFCIPSDPE